MEKQNIKVLVWLDGHKFYLLNDNELYGIKYIIHKVKYIYLCVYPYVYMYIHVHI